MDPVQPADKDLQNPQNLQHQSQQQFPPQFQRDADNFNPPLLPPPPVEQPHPAMNPYGHYPPRPRGGLYRRPPPPRWGTYGQFRGGTYRPPIFNHPPRPYYQPHANYGPRKRQRDNQFSPEWRQSHGRGRGGGRGRGRGNWGGYQKYQRTEQQSHQGAYDPFYDESMFEDPWKDLLSSPQTVPDHTADDPEGKSPVILPTTQAESTFQEEKSPVSSPPGEQRCGDQDDQQAQDQLSEDHDGDMCSNSATQTPLLEKSNLDNTMDTTPTSQTESSDTSVGDTNSGQ